MGLCTFVWVRLGLKDNPSPDPAQCGKPTAYMGLWMSLYTWAQYTPTPTAAMPPQLSPV